MSAILLVQASDGYLVGVEFREVADARAWQAYHEDAGLLVIGCLDGLVAPGEALELSR